MTRDPISEAMERMFAVQEQRLAWLSSAAQQVRKWKAEDAAKGQEWSK